ncbi:MAG TPA: DNA repair protein RadC [Bacteroidales bacterium]|jgi:DNA repair protein RadC|nr:DNA repair protein RadC [Bacteroidales bacterium]HQG21727.1 DNA repair protein RadC [Bacteroidales bacterium]HQI12145.1 DNA repair protein RadC [Bacteroidales bacterium]HQJ14294.1 DNA repair protein RadC [Bacteroidales bacterium]
MKVKGHIDKPHYLDHRSRLRNRFLKQGISGLQPYEIIELFLTFVVPQKDVKPAAKEAINKFGSIKGFFDADEQELSQIPFFKEKALALRKFIKEISLLYYKQQAEQLPVTQSKEDLINYCKAKLGFLPNEEFWMISLDSKKAIVKEDLISKGLTDKTPVYPKQVIEKAMKNGASSILLLHNHPNGNPQASQQDITITKAIDIPARVLNISIYDHIIIAEDKYFSFKENKLI